MIMTELKATPVVKDKFWIVKEDGEKIATIQAVEEGGFVFVHNDRREMFPTVNVLKKSLNIVFDKPSNRKAGKPAHEVHGFPCNHTPYNVLWDVTRKIPIYTKTDKSKSYFCAGYYLIKFANNWVKAYCPKLITLQRYEFQGPFGSAADQQTQLRKSNG